MVVGCGLVVLVLVGDEAGWLRAPIVASSPVKPSLVLAILPMAAPGKRFETAGCSRISSIQPKEIGCCIFLFDRIFRSSGSRLVEENAIKQEGM